MTKLFAALALAFFLAAGATVVMTMQPAMATCPGGC
jgi:hypothetical protein